MCAAVDQGSTAIQDPPSFNNVGSAIALLGFGLAVFAVASTGAIFRPGDWYERLNKPNWRPPNWLFGPAWATLYAMIAIAGWIVWREFGFSGAPAAFAFYTLQLALNALWSPIFFGLKRPGIAMAELVFLWLAIAATIVAFNSFVQTAALLLLPYLAWVTFAGALNFAIWRMNQTTEIQNTDNRYGSNRER